MNAREEIAAGLSRVLALDPFGVEKPPEELAELLEVPRDSALGDLAFPCFALARDLRRAPPRIAEELEPAVAEELGRSGRFSRIAAVGPYLNFQLDRARLASELVPAILGGDHLERRPLQHCRIMIEYSQPNTHKAFHVGHTRNVALGDALIRICEWEGHEVIAANYLGDEGSHIAKCLWYYLEHFDGEVPEENRGEFLGELYTRAVELLDFTTLTRAPHPGVVTARVRTRSPHPDEDRWQIVDIDDGQSVHRVICGGTGYEVDDVVAYARVGVQIGGRLVAVTSKSGVDSEGMICSGKEISLSRERERIHVFPADTPLGVEVAELLRVPGALPPDRSVLAVMAEREAGVSRVLQSIQDGEPEITELWRRTRQWSLAEFDEIYRWLDVRFDHVFYESEVGDSGKQLVQEFLERGVFVRSEGAIGVELGESELPFFLLLKSDGTSLYATKDLALAQAKFERFHIDRSVYVVDAGQSLHFQQVFETLERMGYDKAKNCHHLAYGQVVLPEGKMSSRKGNVILFSQLKERLITRIRTEFLEKYVGDWEESAIEEAARRIAIATIKYGMLNQDNLKNIVFDLEEWTSATGNTGPYLMYAYTRTRSILRELAEIGYRRGDDDRFDWALLVNEHEQDLLRRLQSFPDTVERAAQEYQPKLLCIYLYDLCRELSRMYNSCHVKNAETEELRAARAALVEATGLAIRRGLNLLGIETLERM